ncbi:uncharacterized protein LOC109283178 [Alligator mississippiensis]|uniref:Uncharacterized protein n=1 Tax=Alligator mississippiensis TaxID=8496 RepID=A0A151PGM1_ALLMI|nr:uncharacterized protein LOC109283178 [Alligator mississippiensis]KYO48251.1 hypothetical protein Y1Q_0010625 [Alligator mississippiensis]
MPEIVPRKEAPGTGVFRKSNGDYIIRSDLGCYLRTQFLETGHSTEIRDLHPSCRDGEHYLGSERDPNIYIIKRDSYRVVQDLSTDQGAKVYELHPNCRGGDHYMKCSNFFLILFCERGVMRGVGNLSTDYEGEDVPLHPQCRLGLYYFGIANFRAFIKMDERWGTQFYLYKNMTTATLAAVYSIHPSVLNFLTGGLALTNGSSSGSWHCIKTLSNDSDVPVSWTHMITRKVGFAKEKVSSIERNWQVCASVALKAGELTAAIVKAQLALSGHYGGSNVKTEQEDWTEAREEEETLQATLQPKQNLYVWQYRLSLGPEPVLFCRDIKFTRDPTPPTTNPLPSCS